MVVVIRSDHNRDSFSDAGATWDVEDGMLTVFVPGEANEDRLLAQYLGWVAVYDIPEGS